MEAFEMAALCKWIVLGITVLFSAAGEDFVKVNIHTGISLSVTFTEDKFKKFYECLCNERLDRCKAYYTSNKGHNDVTTVKSEGVTKNPSTFNNCGTFENDLDIFIECSKSSSFNKPYQYFIFQNVPSCVSPCIAVTGKGNQNFSVETGVWFEVFQRGCPQKSAVTTTSVQGQNVETNTKVTEDNKRTPTIRTNGFNTTEKVKGSQESKIHSSTMETMTPTFKAGQRGIENVTREKKTIQTEGIDEESQTDNKTWIAIGVSLAVSILIAFIVLCVFLRRNKKQGKYPPRECLTSSTPGIPVANIRNHSLLNRNCEELGPNDDNAIPDICSRADYRNRIFNNGSDNCAAAEICIDKAKMNVSPYAVNDVRSVTGNAESGRSVGLSTTKPASTSVEDGRGASSMREKKSDVTNVYAKLHPKIKKNFNSPYASLSAEEYEDQDTFPPDIVVHSSPLTNEMGEYSLARSVHQDSTNQHAGKDYHEGAATNKGSSSKVKFRLSSKKQVDFKTCDGEQGVCDETERGSRKEKPYFELEKVESSDESEN